MLENKYLLEIVRTFHELFLKTYPHLHSHPIGDMRINQIQLYH